MKIQHLIFCGAALLLLGNRVSADDLTGQWAGLAPDGLVFPSASGKCNADVLLDLTDNGGVLSGSFRAIVQIETDGCLTQNYLSREVTTNQILPTRLTGTVGVGYTLLRFTGTGLPQETRTPADCRRRATCTAGARISMARWPARPGRSNQRP